MKRLTTFTKSPFYWFVLAFLLNSFLKLNNASDVQQYIKSDGRGYYAYLPAIFIFNDPTFEKSLESELSNAAWKGDPLYLYPSENGGVYNKYFPGVTILQAPFFGLACASAWLTNNPVDGYSNIFHGWYFIGSILYGLLALLLFRRLMRELYPEKKKAIDWWIPALFLSSTLLFYVFEAPSYTHHYSFFLFSLASLIGVKLSRSFSIGKLFWLGAVFGLIFLVRPTNILFVLFLPFLFGSKDSFVDFMKKVFEKKAKGFLAFVLGFAVISIFLMLIWKWESGQWILWSYSGEGFDFLSPKIWQNLFSWRVGLFIHTPVCLLLVFGLLQLWKESKFHLLIWCIYFSIVLYVISAWWCWDYESPFGNRPFTEHMAFLLFPLFVWLTSIKRVYFALIMICFSALGTIRFFQIKMGTFSDQRYISGSAYVSSLAFWKTENHQRYNFGRSCVPFGEKEKDEFILSKLESTQFSPNDLYGFGGEIDLPTIEKNNRYYYRVNLDKWQDNVDFRDVFVVVDAMSKDSSHRYYKAIPMFHDRLSKGKWNSLEFTGVIEDNFKVYQNVKVYIWNPGKKSFKLKNVRFVLEKYVQ